MGPHLKQDAKSEKWRNTSPRPEVLGQSSLEMKPKPAGRWSHPDVFLINSFRSQVLRWIGRRSVHNSMVLLLLMCRLHYTILHRPCQALNFLQQTPISAINFIFLPGNNRYFWPLARLQQWRRGSRLSRRTGGEWFRSSIHRCLCRGWSWGFP